MEVTRKNFEKIFQDIKKDIDSCTFISIDGEFTGLSSHSEVTPYDTLTEYYTKTRLGSKDFLLIQLGLSIFRFDNATKCYKYKCYNFYAFPKPHSRHAADFRFLCQSSCIDFLASQGFDFNKLFRDGIPYMTKDEEMYLREQMEEKNKLRQATTKADNYITVPDNDKDYIDQICKKVDKFLDSDDTELVLDRCNSFLRRLLYQELETRFKNKLFIESKTLENKNIVLVIQKALNNEELLTKEQQRKEREQQEFNESIGLSRLLQYISASAKLIVGHNMLLDLMHIIKQFFGPLPESYQDFKDLLHEIFPKILDTKVLSYRDPFKDKISSNVLGHLLASLSEEPFTIPAIEPESEEYGYKINEIKEHEAAYDAVMTAKCFLSMASYIQSPESDIWTGDFKYIDNYTNSIFVMRLQDVPYMNLNGHDVIPSRDHVFHVSFPEKWKNSDIAQLFSAYGNVQVFWLTKTSAMVALHRKENALPAMKALTKQETNGNNYKVLSYMQYRSTKKELDHKTIIEMQKAESKMNIDMLPKNEAAMRVSRKRRLPSESTDTKEEPLKYSQIDKHGPSVKVSRKTSKSESEKSASGVFEVSDDWD